MKERYFVYGEHDGNDFHAPTMAESEEDAIEKFLRQVDEEEFEVTGAR